MVRTFGSITDKAFLDSWRFTGSNAVPARVTVSDAAVLQYDKKELEVLMQQHPLLFSSCRTECLDPHSRTSRPWQMKGKYTDSWGAVWECLEEGMTGTVISHPLKDAPEGLDTYRFPDPQREDGWQKVNWEEDVLPRLEADRYSYGFCTAALRHGFFFLTLTYLLGYEKLVYAMNDEQPFLDILVSHVEKFHLEIITILSRASPALWCFPDDLGAQVGPLLSPRDFRRYVMPSYKRLLSAAKTRKALAYLHADGDVRALAEDIVSCGFDVVNIQDRVNTLESIRELFCGRTAIDLDIDRQEITRTGSPRDIKEWIREACIKLMMPGGGLTLMYDLYPGIPMENIASVMDALESAYRGELHE